MMPFHFGPAGDLFAGAFGVAAAVLLVGGAFLLRWQRNRQQFMLAKTALDAGVTRFASGPPTWLMSMRQGLTTLTLGISLLVLGGMAYGLTRNAPLPPVTVTQVITTQAQQPPPMQAPPPPPARRAPRGNGAPPPPPRHNPPPPPNPAMEQWHRTQAFNTLGLAGLAAGFVLSLLGGMRSGFAVAERRYDRTHESNALTEN